MQHTKSINRLLLYRIQFKNIYNNMLYSTSPNTIHMWTLCVVHESLVIHRI